MTRKKIAYDFCNLVQTLLLREHGHWFLSFHTALLCKTLKGRDRPKRFSLKRWKKDSEENFWLQPKCKTKQRANAEIEIRKSPVWKESDRPSRQKTYRLSRYMHTTNRNFVIKTSLQDIGSPNKPFKSLLMSCWKLFCREGRLTN